MTETILAIAAHNDDHVIGAGGALAKYAGEGKRVVTVVFSFGANSHPHFRKEVIVEKRVRECSEADIILGGAGVTYLGVSENHFEKEFKSGKTAKMLIGILRKERPSKIFTHGFDDLHPDHRSVYRLVSSLISKQVIHCPVYSFEVWSLFRFRNRNFPRLVVDTSDTFNIKVKAFLAHESQTLAIWSLLWKVIVKDWFSGLLNNCKYAEVFYRLR